MQDQSPYGNLNIEIMSPFGLDGEIIDKVLTESKINQALEELGKYVDNASDDDGHNDKVVDNAYKLLKEVVNGINSK